MHHQHVLSSIRTTCARFPNLVFAVAVSLPFALLILLALGLVWGTGQARAEDDASCTGVSLVEQLARTDPENLPRPAPTQRPFRMAAGCCGRLRSPA
jgi:hypothetical protein